ncbi:MAG: ATPase domain-containing protein, partial [Alphaproteobacteria bacterium]
MSRARATFVCSECGAIAQKWQGRCEACNAWNTLHEEAATKAPSSLALGQGRAGELLSLAGKSEPVARLSGGMAEFDHVIGGGFVAGSALLVGGDPGIGKSTLLLQIAAAMAQAGSKIVYVSGEEAIEQVRMRAERLGLRDAPVLLVAETRVEDILATVKSAGHADLIIVDSIQTLWTDIADSAPGTVTQVRNSTQALIRHAKSTGTIVVLVGHVTKDGQIAGPRVVEHMVDAVLYFEGDSGHQYRILRTVKNRFGPAGEIGLFEMTGTGLKEVASPSELFIGDKSGSSPGAAVLASLEGSRPILVE